MSICITATLPKRGQNQGQGNFHIFKMYKKNQHVANLNATGDKSFPVSCFSIRTNTTTYYRNRPTPSKVIEDLIKFGGLTRAEAYGD